MCENPGRGGGEGNGRGNEHNFPTERRKTVWRNIHSVHADRQPFTSFSWFIGPNEN